MERVNGENSHCNKKLNNYREERMIKKIFMCLMLVLAFTACQSLNYVKEKKAVGRPESSNVKFKF